MARTPANEDGSPASAWRGMGPRCWTPLTSQTSAFTPPSPWTRGRILQRPAPMRGPTFSLDAFSTPAHVVLKLPPHFSTKLPPHQPSGFTTPVTSRSSGTKGRAWHDEVEGYTYGFIGEVFVSASFIGAGKQGFQTTKGRDGCAMSFRDLWCETDGKGFGTILDEISTDIGNSPAASSSSQGPSGNPPVYNKVRGSKRAALALIADPVKRHAAYVQRWLTRPSLSSSGTSPPRSTRLSKMDAHTSKLLDIEAEGARIMQESESTPVTDEDKDEAQFVINMITKKCHRILTRTGKPRIWKNQVHLDLRPGH